MATSRSTLPEGYLLGDYQVVRVLGAGGFGITYLARDPRLQRFFAIKEYSPFELSSREGTTIYPNPGTEDDYQKGLEDFLREARTLARFSHPNIVGVARIFEANGTAYMVLNFEEGSTFSDWVRERSKPVTQADMDGILTPLLDALEAMHTEGVLHRDISPDNIYVRRNGTPVLLDFGSARQSASRSHSMSAIVKPHFSPQEQYSNRAANQGPWTDVYALSATAYRAIAGIVPPEAAERVVEDEYIPLTQHRPAGFRANFLAAIDWGMEVKPADRPQSIGDWRGPLLHDLPAPAQHRSPRSSDRSALATRAVRAGLNWPVMAVSVAFAALAVGGTWYYYHAQLDAAGIEVASAKDEIGSLQLRAAQADQALSTARGDLDKAKADAEVRTAALQSQITDSEARAKQLSDQLDAAKSAASVGDSQQVQSLSAKVGALQSTLDDERQRTAELTKSAADTDAALKTATARYEDAEAAAKRAEDNAAAESQRNQTNLDDALTKLKAAQDAETAAQNEVSSTKSDLANAQAGFDAKVASLTADRDAANANITTLEKELADAKSAASTSGASNSGQSQIDELQQQLDAERQRAAGAASASDKVVASLNGTISDLTDKLAAQNAAVTKAMGTVQDVRAAAASQIADAEKREADADDAAAAAQKALNDAKSKADSDAQSAAAQIADAQKMQQDLGARLAAAQQVADDGSSKAASALSDMQEQLSDQKKQYDELVASTNDQSARAAAHIKQLSDEYDAEKRALDQAVSDAQSAQAQSQKMTDAMSAHVADLQSQLAAAGAAQASLQAALDTATKNAAAQAAAQDKALTDAKADTARLTAALESAQQAGAASDPAVVEQIGELTKRLNDQTQANAALATAGDKQKADLTANLAALQQQLDETQKSRQSLLNEKDQLEKQAAARVADLQSELDRLTADEQSSVNAAVASGEQQSSALEQQLDSNQTMVASLQKEIDTLRNLGAAPSFSFAGVEVAAVADASAYVVRSVAAGSPFEGLLQSGKEIDSLSVAGKPVDLADKQQLASLSPAACDAVSVTPHGAASVAGHVPATFGRPSGGQSRTVDVAGLTVDGADGTGAPVIDAIVADSPAGRAGLQQGDLVLDVAGIAPEGANHLGTQLETAAQHGGRLPVTIERNCERQQASLDFGAPVQQFAWSGLQLSATDATVPQIAMVDSSSPLGGAGLQPKDLLSAVESGGKTLNLTGAAQAQQALADLKLCGTVELTIKRGGAQLVLRTDVSPDPSSGRPVTMGDFGIEAISIPDRGLLVKSVVPNQPFAASGLQPGDLITAIGQTQAGDLGAMTDATREQFERSGGTVTVERGCTTANLTVAAHDPNDDPITLADLSQAERRLIVRALHGMGLYESGDMPTDFVNSGAPAQDLTDAITAFRTQRGETTNASLTRRDTAYLIPLGQTKMPSELEQDALRAVLPPLVLANPDLIADRMRMFAATKGFSAVDGREALKQYQTSVGQSVAPGYVASESEARRIFADPLVLNPPPTRQMYGDWRAQQIAGACSIFTLPVEITGAFYHYSDNASFADRPKLWLRFATKGQDGQVSAVLSGDFGGTSSDLDPLQSATLTTDTGKTLVLQRLGDSLLPIADQSGGGPFKALLGSRWIEVRGISRYGGELRFRYNTSGFDQAFNYLNSTCGHGTLGAQIQ